MAQIPAHCPNCNLIFPSGIAANNVVRLELQDNRSMCPRCGTSAPVIEGVFNIQQDAISVVTAPWATFEVLTALARLLGNAYETDKPAEEAASEAGRLRRELEDFVLKSARKTKTRKWALYLLAALLFALHINFNFNVDANVNVNELVNQIIHALKVKEHRKEGDACK